MIGLNKVATVYGRGAGGLYNVPLKSGLRCRLAHIDLRGATSGGQRADLSSLRRLIWEPGYVMPEGSVIEVEAQRWRVVRGTFGAYPGPSGMLAYRAADAIRQET